MRRRALQLLLLCLTLTFLPSVALAIAPQTSPAPQVPATQAQIEALQKAIAEAQAASSRAQSAAINAQFSGDNAWMLTSAALVLLMTGPGLALFYGGLVRKKNILGTMMQSFAMMGLVTVLWALVGYSLAFGHGNWFVGGFEHLFLKGVSLSPNTDYAPTIPEQTLMIYQLMFAIITPALITGAFAERMKFSAMAIFLSLWSLFVYCPMAHMVWGVGGLLNSAGGRFPSLDFAGGTVVHITSGVSALVCALYLGKRIGYPQTKMQPHSMVLSAAAIGWSIAEWIHNGKPTALGAISGAVAGLVAITPASGFVQPMSALAIGAIAGFFCFFMVFVVKGLFGYDDSLDAFGVHGAGGTLGAILTGLFAASVINPVFGKDAPVGAIDGNWHQIMNQLAGVGIAWAISLVGTVVLLFVVDQLVGLRVSAEDEAAGLDLSQHNEEGYDFAT